MPLDKILMVTHAASHEYDRKLDRYKRKVLLYDPFQVGHVVNVPRVAPPRSKLEPRIKEIRDSLGIETFENGQLAMREILPVLADLLRLDPSTCSTPSRELFLTGELRLPIVIMLDATGFKSKQLTTIAVRNPYMSKSAHQLRVIGLGNCADDCDGATRLTGPNLPVIRDLVSADQNGRRVDIGGWKVIPQMMFCFDLSALRHCEHLAGSGFCGCPREKALRERPAKPATVPQMYEALKDCLTPSLDMRYVQAHVPLPNETRPRPCTAVGCKYAHNPATATADAEYAALLAEESRLGSDKSKSGKARWYKFRSDHSKAHNNVQPGLYGAPLFRHELGRQLLCALHAAELNVPKTPWKHGILNNCSDDGREGIRVQLKAWGFDLDTRRKDDNRNRAQKWFTGEAWHKLCTGAGKNPGGPVAIATLVMIMADDLQNRGAVSGAADGSPNDDTPSQPTGRGRGRQGQGGRRARRAEPRFFHARRSRERGKRRCASRQRRIVAAGAYGCGAQGGPSGLADHQGDVRLARGHDHQLTPGAGVRRVL
jgi:hypothetical protein